MAPIDRFVAVKKLLKIYPIIFREFVAYTILFTIIALGIYQRFGWLALPYIFWTKVIGFCSVVLLYNFSKSKQLPFFYNLGYSAGGLLMICAASDLLIFVAAIAITNLFI